MLEIDVHRRHRDSGMTLVEVLVSVVILSMIAVGFATFAITSLHQVGVTTQRVQALELARKAAIQLMNGTAATQIDKQVTIRGITYAIYDKLSTRENIHELDPDLHADQITVSWDARGNRQRHLVQLTVYLSN
ncbi:type IV pilus modification PilV family protein [Sulfoacidibacillus thermotolerans]|uniref:Prepilin-type N-terminal cleavage/methylation domain-containing protein n=1 Tax=Sulfoacidibacillus thermotolerans TaxID=1765684 RepID=A0A2U3DC22_SULT2|nr:prepilin-type N-terminal cleavage/methylation domain-containing protein [Sulfoacidibacillus thermotolerans]PWI58834.1 hypothetical protein BM613_01715 [Sulfoacidibacillus thermotolerans]